MLKVDCLIVGGGMVGATTALALAELGLKVAVVEAYAPKEFSSEQDFDLRVSAISLGSQQLLNQLGAWQQVENWRACPYKRLGVWENDIAYAEFNSDEIEQPHLGHIVENRLIQLSVWQQLEQNPNVNLLCPEQLVSYSQTKDEVVAELSNSTVTARILIGADGANSQVRTLANIGTTGWDYQQSAMLINVKTELPQQDITWQHFSPTGPVAYLPMPGNNGSLVWYHSRDEIKRLSKLSNVQLTQAITQAFPKRLGGIEVVAKGAFNLTRRHANQYVKGRVILVGDSAHTINPLAGQGVNLGFKDIKALQEVIAKAIGSGENFDSEEVLKRYERSRRADNLLMMSGMDAIYGTFKNKSGPLKLLRNIGVFAAHRAPILKEKALAYACGL
ncbi:FAD-dependent oxidoreductase [Thalassomonas sp. M1454]|uniref:FAD-dependent oxidoreductase n=1 Tax=Thalassomonas sp. M1454 TaxID=2594477 RepID=UPI00117CA567|nr:FAD-dependent oxidoreductase [Thalassomonas sp. M1454]TRX55685.1 FAD-dependent oxidoreductase [Thalassomonas sp. M1454]